MTKNLVNKAVMNKNCVEALNYYYYFIPSDVKIPRVKNKVKSKTKSCSGH